MGRLLSSQCPPQLHMRCPLSLSLRHRPPTYKEVGTILGSPISSTLHSVPRVIIPSPSTPYPRAGSRAGTPGSHQSGSAGLIAGQLVFGGGNTMSFKAQKNDEFLR